MISGFCTSVWLYTVVSTQYSVRCSCVYLVLGLESLWKGVSAGNMRPSMLFTDLLLKQTVLSTFSRTTALFTGWVARRSIGGSYCVFASWE